MLKRSSSIIFISLLSMGIVCLLSVTGCSSARHYIENDSTGIYSTHASRPFRYGYAYTLEESKNNYDKWLIDYGIKNGDVVADVGAASGWKEGIISVFVDSVTFYIEDIDTNFSSEAQLKKVVNYYSKIRARPQTNTFRWVKGTEKRTYLPDSTFDKVLLLNTYHELMNPWGLFKDISKKLKPGGKIVISDNFSNSYKKIRHAGCNLKAEEMEWVVTELRDEGFYLTRLNAPESSFSNVLTFERNQGLSDEYARKQLLVQPYIRELDKLNELAIANDSAATEKIAYFLKDNLDTIASVYKRLEAYIQYLSYEWKKEKQYDAGLHVFKVATVLYPDSEEDYNDFIEESNDDKGSDLLNKKQYAAAIAVFEENVRLFPCSGDAYERLGEAYMKNKQYDLALVNYSKSVEVDTDHAGNEKIIDQLKSLIRESK